MSADGPPGSPHVWPAPAKRWTLRGAALLAILGVVFSGRLFVSELLVLPSLRLDELRLFFPARNYEAPVAGSYTAVLDAAIQDGSAVHADYARCLERLRDAATAGKGVAAAEARRECLTILNEALARTPADGRLWLEQASLTIQTDGFSEPVFDALRMSFKVAPREGSIAAARADLLIRVWIMLPADIRDVAASDVGLLLSTEPLTQQLVEIYLQQRGARKIIADLVEQAGRAEQQRFVSRLRNAVR